MKKQIMVLFLGLFVLGCGVGHPKDKAVLARINNYEITAQEFEQEFEDSPYAALGTADAKKQFLDSLINRKLILQEAQAAGLDRDRAFLKSIERFWEQSLLKIYLDEKTNAIHALARASVDEKTVQAAYQKIAEAGKADKPYAQMHDQIRWGLMKAREAALMDEWLAQLRRKADIRVNTESQGGQK